MSADSTDVLTYEQLMAAVADIRAAFNPLRIIADFPLVPTDHAGLIKAENVLVIGRNAWRELQRHCTRTSALMETLYGINVETFDLAREDHRALVRSLLPTTVMRYKYDPRYDLVPWHPSYLSRPFAPPTV